MWSAIERLIEKASPGLILLLCIAAIIGGVAYFQNNPGQQAQFSQQLMATAESNRQAAEQCLREATQLQIELARVQQQVVLLQSSEDSWPFPAWLKDTSGRVQYANPAYVDEYLIPRGYRLSDYQDQTDFNVWPEEIALKFRAHDTEVARTKQWKLFWEQVIAADGTTKYRLFIKYPRMIGDTVIGVAGREIPVSIPPTPGSTEPLVTPADEENASRLLTALGGS